MIICFLDMRTFLATRCRIALTGGSRVRGERKKRRGRGGAGGPDLRADVGNDCALRRAHHEGAAVEPKAA
jgi:hypothetical protein